MHSLEDIRDRSISKSELVVNYSDAMELLYIFQHSSTPILGWEGWLIFEDGTVTHSQRNQGISDLSSLPFFSAISLARSTIMQANTEQQSIPEAANSELYFCMTTNA
jgi:hypothetical protein